MDCGHFFGHVLGCVVGDDSGVGDAVADWFECGDEVVCVAAAVVAGPVVEFDGDVVLGWEV